MRFGQYSFSLSIAQNASKSSGVDPAPAMDGQHLLQASSKGVTHHLGGTAWPAAPPHYLFPKTLAMTLEKGKTIAKSDKSLFPNWNNGFDPNYSYESYKYKTPLTVLMPTQNATITVQHQLRRFYSFVS